MSGVIFTNDIPGFASRHSWRDSVGGDGTPRERRRVLALLALIGSHGATLERVTLAIQNGEKVADVVAELEAQ